MKKRKRSGIVGLLIAIGVCALAVWIAYTLPPPRQQLSTRVKVEQLPPEEKPVVEGEEKAEKGVAAGISLPAPAEHEVGVPENRMEIAIVIDDMGLNLSGSQRAIKLPSYVTLSFMPYAEHLDEQTARAVDAGHELLLHMPMEPVGHDDPGPGALLTKLSPDEIRTRFDKALDSFEDFDGVNNHMGSKFSADAAGMEIVIEELQKRHLFFLDSRTSAKSVGAAIAQKHDLPNVSRDVFLDDSMTPEAVAAQLAATEKVARRKGHAVAIGHPHDVTLKALEEWIPEAEKRGFTFVPVHDFLKARMTNVSAP
jgi:hypothetical protein